MAGTGSEKEGGEGLGGVPLNGACSQLQLTHGSRAESRSISSAAGCTQT